MATYFSYAVASDSLGGKVTRPDSPPSPTSSSSRRRRPPETTVRARRRLQPVEERRHEEPHLLLGLRGWHLRSFRRRIQPSSTRSRPRLGWYDVKLLVSEGKLNASSSGFFRQVEPIDFFPTRLPGESCAGVGAATAYERCSGRHVWRSLAGRAVGNARRRWQRHAVDGKEPVAERDRQHRAHGRQGRQGRQVREDRNKLDNGDTATADHPREGGRLRAPSLSARGVVAPARHGRLLFSRHKLTVCHRWWGVTRRLQRSRISRVAGSQVRGARDRG